MTSYSNKHQLRKWSISVFFLSYVLWVHSYPYSTVEVKDNPLHEYRIKRQVCQDGIQPGGSTCCMCPAGEHLEKQCTSNSPRTCTPCVSGRTYNSVPNARDSCEPCRHCDPNANLEEEKPCTTTVNTVCRCQKEHYCDQDRENCRICHPCLKCGSEGIKADCTATNNTICNDKKPKGEDVAAAVLIPLFIVLFLAAGIGCYFWGKKRRFGRATEPANGEINNTAGSTAEELEPIKGVDLSPHLSDIASLLGWKIMRDLARRSGMSKTAIEAHELNHPGDVEERTLHLLTDWVEKQGIKASETLMEMLRKMDKNATAEKVKEIIKRSGHPSGNNTQQV